MFPTPINTFVSLKDSQLSEDKNVLMELLQPHSHSVRSERIQEPFKDSNKLPSLNEVIPPSSSSNSFSTNIPTMPSKPVTQPTTTRPIILPPPKPHNEPRIERRRYSLPVPSFLSLPESRSLPPLDTFHRNPPLVQKAIPVTTHPLNNTNQVPQPTTTFSKTTEALKNATLDQIMMEAELLETMKRRRRHSTTSIPAHSDPMDTEENEQLKRARQRIRDSYACITHRQKHKKCPPDCTDRRLQRPPPVKEERSTFKATGRRSITPPTTPTAAGPAPVSEGDGGIATPPPAAPPVNLAAIPLQHLKSEERMWITQLASMFPLTGADKGGNQHILGGEAGKAMDITGIHDAPKKG